ncbi:MAG: hypothetical protein QOH23_1463 [Gaiellaceae bacterium]|nr:hypothetical protein [Gaiellaceae bacterium]
MSVAAARRWWPLAAGILLGLVVGLLVSLLASSTRRAEASVLISSPAGTGAVTPMLPNLQQLATSGVLAGNVQSTLRLPQSTADLRRHLHAVVRPQSQVIAISATDTRADRARQVAQEASIVFARLVDAHFGTAKPQLHAALLDSAHVLPGRERHYLRNVLFGTLAGLLLGSAAMFVLASRVPLVYAERVGDDRDAKRDRELRKREAVLEQRLHGVTARERAMAERAGKLAVRERELDERETKLDSGERDLAERMGEVASDQRELAERASVVAADEQALEERTAEAPPEPEPVVEAPAGPAAVRVGSWNVNDLQRMVDAQTEAPPEQAEEWRSYLFFLREHSASDGSLPPQFDGLVEDIFGAIVLRDVSG